MQSLLALALAVPAWADGSAPAAHLGLPPVLEAPTRPADVAGDCLSKRAAPSGVSRDCDAISVPPSYLAYLESTRVYSDQLRAHLVAERSVAEADARSCADALDWRDAELSRAREPVPFVDRPGVKIAAGGLVGAALVIGGGWAVGQVAP